MSKRWETIEGILDVPNCARYHSVEALRRLANAYKHDPWKEPDEKLLTHLSLDRKLTYAQLPESGELQRGLAKAVGLPDHATYCEITESFIRHVDEFLKDVKSRKTLSRVMGKPSLIRFAV